VSSVAQDADTADETTEETTVCETTSETTEAAPVEAVDPADLAANAHGQAVSDVAHSKDVGGKNCNHGGAVSEAAKKDHEAAAAARDAEKAARDAARDAARPSSPRPATRSSTARGMGSPAADLSLSNRRSGVANAAPLLR